jgi:hypothetical protein
MVGVGDEVIRCWGLTESRAGELYSDVFYQSSFGPFEFTGEKKKKQRGE